MTQARRATRVTEMARDPWGVRQSCFFEPDIVDMGARTFNRE